MTARHVVELHHLHGFSVGSNDQFDIAYKYDASIQGLPLGFVDNTIIRGANIVTSLPTEDDQSIKLNGNIGPLGMPSILKVFTPATTSDANNIKKYIQPRASGSPLVYKDHIIGIVPFQNLGNPFEVPVVAFSGYLVKNLLDQIGIKYDTL